VSDERAGRPPRSEPTRSEPARSEPARPGTVPLSRQWQRLRDLPDLVVLAGCIATLALSTALALVASSIGLAHVSQLLLGAVIVNAILWGVWPSLFSVIAANGIAAYLFYAPTFDFHVYAREDLIDLATFTMVALVTSQLAARLRWHAVEAERRNTITAELASFSRRLGAIANAEDLYIVAIEQLEQLLGGTAVILLPQDRQFVTLAARMQDNLVPASIFAEASRLWAAQELDEDARGATVEGWRLRLLQTWRGGVGILAIAPEARSRFTVDELAPILDQAASAIERTMLTRAIEDTRLRRVREDLQEALVGSMSHSLQTPLASIIGSVTSLQNPASRRNEAVAADLVATIRDEAERLERFVGRILQMTRIRAGAVAPRLELVELPDIINAALRRLRRVLAQHRVDIRLPGDLPMLRLDLFLMEEALANLLENAAKYAPKGTTIRIEAFVDDRDLILDVADQGIGIEPATLPRLFEPFFRGGTVDAKAPGTGLGLAICRAFVRANDGTVEALLPEPSGPARAGAVLRVRLPIPPQPQPELGRDE